MAKYLIYVFFGFIGPKGIAQSNSCINGGQIIKPIINTEMWISLTKELAIESASKDLKGFCEWNRMDRATSTFFKNQSEKFLNYRKEKMAGNKENAVSLMLTQPPSPGAWPDSLFGHPRLKNRGVVGSAFDLCNGKTLSDCASLFRSAISSPSLSGNYTLPQYTPLSPRAFPSARIMMGCAFIDFLAVGCAKASKDLLEEVGPVETSRGVEVALPAMVSDTLANSRITNSLRRTAGKLWEKIGNERFDSTDSIYSDLVRELKAERFSDAEAKREAIKILGSIATGGPNFSGRVNLSEIYEFPNSCLPPKDCNLNAIFMSAIAEAMVHADTFKMKNAGNGPYSLPAGANFTCDSGKAYHFWMAAAITERLIAKGHSARSARAAAFLSQLAYHFRPSSMMLDRSNDLLSFDRFGAAENGLRIDINFAAAGSSFGANVDSQDTDSVLNLNDGLINMMKNSNSRPSEAPLGTSRVLESSEPNAMEWLARIGAKTAYSSYP